MALACGYAELPPNCKARCAAASVIASSSSPLIVPWCRHVDRPRYRAIFGVCVSHDARQLSPSGAPPADAAEGAGSHPSGPRCLRCMSNPPASSLHFPLFVTRWANYSPFCRVSRQSQSSVSLSRPRLPLLGHISDVGSSTTLTSPQGDTNELSC